MHPSANEMSFCEAQSVTAESASYQLDGSEWLYPSLQGFTRTTMTDSSILKAAPGWQVSFCEASCTPFQSQHIQALYMRQSGLCKHRSGAEERTVKITMLTLRSHRHKLICSPAHGLRHPSRNHKHAWVPSPSGSACVAVQACQCGS